MYTEVADEWLGDQPHATQLQKKFLEKASAFYERLPDQLSRDAEFRLEAAEHVSELGRSTGGLETTIVPKINMEQSIQEYGAAAQRGPGECRICAFSR